MFLAKLLDIRGDEGRSSGSRFEGVEERLVGERGGEPLSLASRRELSLSLSLSLSLPSELDSFFFEEDLKMFGRTMWSLVEKGIAKKACH